MILRRGLQIRKAAGVFLKKSGKIYIIETFVFNFEMLMSAPVETTTVTILESAQTIMDRSHVTVREVIQEMEHGVQVSLLLV